MCPGVDLVDVCGSLFKRRRLPTLTYSSIGINCGHTDAKWRCLRPGEHDGKVNIEHYIRFDILLRGFE